MSANPPVNLEQLQTTLEGVTHDLDWDAGQERYICVYCETRFMGADGQDYPCYERVQALTLRIAKARAETQQLTETLAAAKHALELLDAHAHDFCGTCQNVADTTLALIQAALGQVERAKEHP